MLKLFFVFLLNRNSFNALAIAKALISRLSAGQRADLVAAVRVLDQVDQFADAAIDGVK